MGQKTNPVIFQVGTTKKWKFPFQEKKLQEFAKYSENQLELQHFIKKYFNDHGLKICDLNLFYTHSTLTIFITYFPGKPFFSTKTVQNTKLKKTMKYNKTRIPFRILAPIFRQKFLLRRNDTKRKFLEVFLKTKQQQKAKKLLKKLEIKHNLVKCFLNKRLKKAPRRPKKRFIPHKKYIPQLKKKKTPRRLKRIKNYYNNSMNLHFLEVMNSLQPKDRKETLFTNQFINNMCKTISLFNGTPSLKIVCNIKQLDLKPVHNFTKTKVKLLKKVLNQLWRYNKERFYNEGLQTIILFLKFPIFVEYFANYLALEMQKHNRQHFFLNFIKQSLSLLNKCKLYPSQDIKIQIKGRFNSAPRSKKRIITIGNHVSTISLKSKLHYATSTSFSASGGTLGVKIWTTDKIKQKCFKDQKKQNIKKLKKEN